MTLPFTAALLFGQIQMQTPPLPPEQPPQQEPQIIHEAAPPAPAPIVTPDSRPEWQRHRGRAERDIGLAALGAGYLMGALIVLYPALGATGRREPVQNAGEKRLALVPVAGPMLWWFAARARLDARGCSGCFVDLDSGFHDVLGVPYAVVATGAQAVGIGFLIYGLLESTEEVASSAAPVAKMYVAPTPGGLSLQGTF